MNVKVAMKATEAVTTRSLVMEPPKPATTATRKATSQETASRKSPTAEETEGGTQVHPRLATTAMRLVISPETAHLIRREAIET